MFDSLQENLQNAFKTFQGQSSITHENIESAIREVKRALINSDVSLKAVKIFINNVQEKALGSDVVKGVSAGDQFIKIINDELINLLGHDQKELNIFPGKTSSILMLGLQGAGKTTSCGKLAAFLKKKNFNPLLVPLDLKRPAAIEQLAILGNQIEVPVYRNEILEKELKTLDLAKSALTYAKENNFNPVIFDSAGRLQIDSDLMAELLLVEKFVKPDEKILVIDSMIGQEAANVAASFDTQIGVTGVLLTKLDGDSRGGAALSVVQEINKPIKLAGVGEKIEDLQEFHPDRIASRILGMGDVLTLVEKAQEKIQEDEARELGEKMLKGDFNFETFLQAQNMVGKFGDFSSLFDMMGMGGMLSKFGVKLNRDNKQKLLQESSIKLKRFKSAINSMTKEERKNPDLLNMSRKLRIAKGSGQKEKDIDGLVSEFKVMKQTMGQLKPLLGMMGSKEKANPEELLNSMASQNAMGGNRAQRRMAKGFKPKK